MGVHPRTWEHVLFASDGRTATELAADLFGDPARTVTVRAEMSRLRRHLGGLLSHRPYRIRDGLGVTVLATTKS